MFEKFKILMSTMMLVIATSATAVETINVNGKPGGLSGKLAESLTAGVKSSSATNVSVNYLGNCKVGETLYKKSQGDAWIMNLANATKISTCQFPLQPENLAGVLYGQSAVVCYQKERKELGIKHFLDPSQRKIWITMTWFSPATSTWNHDLGISNNTKVLAIGHSRDVVAASFGREGDYFTVDATTAIEQKDRLSCIFSTGRKPLAELNGVPTLKDLSPKVRYPVLYASQIAIVSNGKNKAEFQKIIAQGKSSAVWKKFISTPGIELFDDIDQWQFFKEQQRLLDETAAETSNKK